MAYLNTFTHQAGILPRSVVLALEIVAEKIGAILGRDVLNQEVLKIVQDLG